VVAPDLTVAARYFGLLLPRLRPVGQVEDGLDQGVPGRESIARAYPFCRRMASRATLLRSLAGIATLRVQPADSSLKMALPTGPNALRADSM
jgi:hypothetical protein